MSEAFISLATNDEYALGALNLAMSLKRSGTNRDIVLMITNTVSESMRGVLSNVFSHIEVVSVLDSKDEENLGLLERPDLGVTFTKLHCWRLTQYTKAVFMDADTLVLQNIDDLFLREELSGCPDPGWPDCFNSGVFVFEPSMETYNKLLQFALKHGSFDGGDQGLLNMFFSDWSTKDIRRHLPFVYNCVNQFFYSYVPALSHFRAKIKVIHFIGPIKPWQHSYDQQSGRLVIKEGSGHSEEYLQQWWSIFIADVQPQLPPHMESVPSIVPLHVESGLCGQLQGLDTSTFKLEPVEGGATAPHDHQQSWEQGHIDYKGLDKFDNIKEHLDSKLMGKKK